MGANVDAITQEMAQNANKLNQQAAGLRADATSLMTETQRLADEHVANARRHAEQMLTSAKAQAGQLEEQAEQAEEDAKHWNRISAEQRKRAKLPALPDPLPAQPDGQPQTWKGPDGRIWDLTIHYVDPTGATWRWTGRFEIDGNVTWPVMTRTDFAEMELQLPKCPPLNPIPDSSGDVRVATGDPETAVMPPIDMQAGADR